MFLLPSHLFNFLYVYELMDIYFILRAIIHYNICLYLLPNVFYICHWEPFPVHSYVLLILPILLWAFPCFITSQYALSSFCIFRAPAWNQPFFKDLQFLYWITVFRNQDLDTRLYHGSYDIKTCNDLLPYIIATLQTINITWNQQITFSVFSLYFLSQHFSFWLSTTGIWVTLR